MELLCLGLSHKTAPLRVRERLALGNEQLGQVIQQLAQAVPEVMLLCTCNRVEFYAAGETADAVLMSAFDPKRTYLCASGARRRSAEWRAKGVPSMT